jgi:sugar phosphate isomerase/epimerase
VESFGLRVVALQSLLFQRPELTLFGTAEARAKTANRLRMLCDAASEIGATVLVFGSPKNRQRGLLSLEAADEIAVPFFGALGDHAHSRGVSLCIEPLPTSLGCDYIHTAEDGARLARKVGSQGFALHLDASALHANRETPEHAVAGSIDVLRHFHISETGYVEPGASGVDHSGMAAALRAHGYAGAVSIEMTSVPTADSGPRVRAALDYARSVYV